MQKKQDEENIDYELRSLLPRNIRTKAYIQMVHNKVSKKNNNNSNNCNVMEKMINNSFEKTRDPLVNKILKNLIRTEEELKQKISKYNSNEKLLKNNSYINVFNKNNDNVGMDKTHIKDSINIFEKNKNLISSKVNFINFQINNIQNYQEKISGDFKQKINDNLNKLNKTINNNILEKKKNTQSENPQKSLLNFCKIKRVNSLRKEEEQKRAEFLKEKRDKEREDIVKRQKKNTESVVNLLKFIKEKPSNESYIYKKIKQNYEDKENDLIKNENLKRKKKMKSIDGQELAYIERSFQEYKEHQENELKEKTKKLKQEWSKRQKMLSPLSVNSISKKINEEKEKNEKEKELKLKRIIDLKSHQVEYSKQILLPITKINDNKKKKNTKNNKNSLTDRKNNHIIINKKCFNRFYVHSINLSEIIRKKNMTNKKRINNEDNKCINKSEEMLPSKRTHHYIKRYKSNIIYDYLAEKRKEYSEKNQENKNTKRINNYIKGKGINERSINNARYRIDDLDIRKSQKDLLLKYSGGIANNVELGEELCDLLVDSINARISVIEKINKSVKFIRHKEKEKEKENENDKNGENLENYFEIDDNESEFLKGKNLSLNQEINNEL